MPASGKIKQKTVNGKTITLHQLKNTMKHVRNTQYMYEVRVDGSAIGDPDFSKSAGMSKFEATVSGNQKDTKRGSNGRRQPNSGGLEGLEGFGGGRGGGGFGGGGFF